MAKDKIVEYDATANNNTVVGDVNLAENSMNPSDVNNAIREVMSHQKEAFGAGTPLYVDQANNRVGVNKTPTVALDVNGAITSSDGMIITTADNTDTLSLISTDADASNGPNLNMFRNSSSPADNDFLGNVKFNGRNDNSQDVQYGELEVYAADVRDGIEDGWLNFNVMTGGSNLSYLQIKGGTGVVFNEDSNDIDFRVESNAQENMLVVNGGHNSVQINTNAELITGDAVLSVRGQIEIVTDAGTQCLEMQRQDAGLLQNFRKNGGSSVGNITISATATAFNTSSDYRLKENVVTSWDATTRLKQLKPSRFNFIADADTTVDGFLAHEVQSVVPEAITGTHNEVDDDGNPVMQGIDQSKLVPLLVKTIQELEARITTLENGE